MGTENFGIPIDKASFIKKLMDLDVFVEGGTFHGETAIQMSNYFQKVFTIEKSEVMFKSANKNLLNFDNITHIFGDTREHLNDILKNNDNILFWLDAHWSGGETYGKSDECPLIEELTFIFSFKKKYIILIDDAELFIHPPPLPHDYHLWPSLKDIFQILPDDWSLIILEDVIYLYPIYIEGALKEYFQNFVTNKIENQNVSTIQKIISKIRLKFHINYAFVS